MSDFIKIDDRDIRKLSKRFKVDRKNDLKFVHMNVLNDLAFDTRTKAIKSSGTIDDAMTIRGGGKLPWVKSSVMVDKAKKSKLQSEIGSKWKWARNKGKKFHGMKSAEDGSTWNPDGIVTPIARVSGLVQKGVSKSTRELLRKPIEINASDLWRQIKQLMALEERAPKYYFRIRHGNRKFKKGVYKFGRKSVQWKNGTKHKEIKMVRDESETSVTQRKKKWLRPAVKRAVTKQSVQKSYVKHFKRVVAQWNRRR